ncbi:hypothetical protein [uncultured Draconibacterium sp.]|uniref:hypothetical protein n=1 Tax=uncultured Draconibacterium sp. TaxID=1573823 RepID=UPI0029C6F934|nr:hypothetical protein [uncultured Draconibacterium sp.]
METESILLGIAAALFILVAGWIFKDKSESYVFKTLNLLPRWMKYVGLIWVILSVILSIIFDFMFDVNNILGIQSANIGLLVICFSKDRVEDEMTNNLRLKSFYKSAILGFAFMMIMDFVELLLGGESFMSSYVLVAIILSMYLFTFYAIKSKIRSAE